MDEAKQLIKDLMEMMLGMEHDIANSRGYEGYPLDSRQQALVDRAEILGVKPQSGSYGVK